jgi:lipopolysaccharide transport system ATP-binding protein
MSSPIISVENVSKSYLISHQHKGAENTLRDKIAMATKSFINRDKTYSHPSDELFWALKDISFDVQQGDRLAIIGSNGAGKSTLFKLISRITAPSKGKITIEGRVASLLEVGTGFHPELTGRENIFLNGTILGMGTKEIKDKFDEIVDFSGVEKFLDTPVKRFSSGMYVRLAFAVAAHLDSEILIVDEVLAVGDADFQNKCLRKIQDISKSGRTILFVSHTMSVLQNLCTKAIYLKNGELIEKGNIDSVINNYLSSGKLRVEKLSDIKTRNGNGDLRFINGAIECNQAYIETFKNINIRLDYSLRKNLIIKQFKIEISIFNSGGQAISWLSTFVIHNDFDIFSNSVEFIIKNNPLAPGNYMCTIYAEINNEVADFISEVLYFTVIEKDYYKTGSVKNYKPSTILLDYTVH